MSNKMFKLNLQLFSDDADGAQSSENPNEGDKGAGSFDEFLSSGENQAEFDRRVEKAIRTATERITQQKQAEIEAAKEEAKRQAGLSAEEKATEEEQQRLADFERREKDLLKRELRASAIDILIEKDLPKNLADILVYSSEEERDNSIKLVESSFSEAVEQEVDRRLARSAKTPRADGQTSQGDPYVELGERLGKQNQTKASSDLYFKN